MFQFLNIDDTGTPKLERVPDVSFYTAGMYTMYTQCTVSNSCFILNWALNLTLHTLRARPINTWISPAWWYYILIWSDPEWQDSRYSFIHRNTPSLSLCLRAVAFNKWNTKNVSGSFNQSSMLEPQIAENNIPSTDLWCLIVVKGMDCYFYHKIMSNFI